MKIKQKSVLRSIFSLKGNFSEGIAVPRKVFEGVEIAPFWNGCKAAVSMSADFELNWAFRCLPPAQRDHLGTTERQNVPYILDLLAEFSMPITWATVGHLFLLSCNGTGKLAHSNMPRPPLNDLWQGDWYMHDPRTDLHRDPLWYCPDLIEKIITNEVAHEIGSHSFSHIDFSLQTSNRELVQREMEQCVAAMEPFKLRSLVYPFNNMGHSYHDLLHDFGIIAVRHRDNKVRLSYPERSSSGVYKIYESMNLRAASYYQYKDKAELFINTAIERGCAFHLWFHPSDPHSVFQNEFRDILQIIESRRKSGDIWPVTMGDLAAYCEAREHLTVQTKDDDNTRTLEIRSSLDAEKYGTPEITLIVPVKGAPKSVRQKIRSEINELSVKIATTGRLILNLPTASQTVTISY